MLSRNLALKALALLLFGSLVLAACGAPAVETVVVQQEGETIVVTATPSGEEVECDNPYLGSCELDGNGIPPDFLSDIHVRKAFNYCFDWDVYIADALNGEAVQVSGPLIPGMIGYDPDGPKYSFDPDQCAAEFQQAWDGAVWETGFRMQIAYNAGNVTRETISAILQNNINEVNEEFQVEIVGLPWPAFLAGIRASAFPIYVSGWLEDIHDPHNWAQPFMVGTYAARQNIPEDLVSQFAELVSAGVGAATDEERAGFYQQLTQADYDNAIAIRLAVPTGRAYFQTWVDGYFFNPIWDLEARYYTLSKAAGAKNPDTLTYATFGGTDTLDPGWNYESAGDGIIQNLYDMLVAYAGPDATTFAPELATDWTISDDGLTYTFNIREGVTFHEGQELSPDDVAYTFQRGLLQGGGFSPQWLYTEAFFGTGTYDIAELVDPDLVDDREALQAIDAETLLGICEQVTSAIVADEEAGTVTMTLAQPWAPLISTLANSWGAILDKDWAIENGAWDGDCATWQDFYGVTSEDAPLRAVANGTGPYALDHWTPGEETVLTANENYWRTEPAWDGGPSGPPAIGTVQILIVDEWSTRRAMMETGDADFTNVPREFVDQLADDVAQECLWDEAQGTHVCGDLGDGPYRVYLGHPLTSRTDAMFVFEVSH